MYSGVCILIHTLSIPILIDQVVLLTASLCSLLLTSMVPSQETDGAEVIKASGELLHGVMINRWYPHVRPNIPRMDVSAKETSSTFGITP